MFLTPDATVRTRCCENIQSYVVVHYWAIHVTSTVPGVILLLELVEVETLSVVDRSLPQGVHALHRRANVRHPTELRKIPVGGRSRLTTSRCVPCRPIVPIASPSFSLLHSSAPPISLLPSFIHPSHSFIPLPRHFLPSCLHPSFPPRGCIIPSFCYGIVLFPESSRVPPARNPAASGQLTSASRRSQEYTGASGEFGQHGV
jgi:hypothetical protein